MTGLVGNSVGIIRDTGANRKEAACQSLARWEEDNREWQVETDLFRAPCGLARVHRTKGGCG
jgi:hypothetical protein